MHLFAWPRGLLFCSFQVGGLGCISNWGCRVCPVVVVMWWLGYFNEGEEKSVESCDGIGLRNWRRGRRSVCAELLAVSQ